MEYRHLGRTGLKVSTVGLGSWLTYGGSVEEDAARRCMERAYELGVNFFDTANVYAGGDAERVVGRTLAEIPRDTVVIATKVYFPTGEKPNQRGLGRKHVLEQCERSLERLGVDAIDLYQCHRWDRETPLDETCRVMDDLVRRGWIHYWGVSEWTAEQIRDAVHLCHERGWSQPVSNQPEYNLLQRRVEKKVFAKTAELGLGNVVWSPLAQGVLTGKYGSVGDVPEDSRAAGPQAGFMGRYMEPDVLEAAGEFVDLADEVGVSPARLALAWCLRRPEVSSVIVGASRPDHVEDNVGAADLDLDAGTIERAGRILEGAQVEGV